MQRTRTPLDLIAIPALLSLVAGCARPPVGVAAIAAAYPDATYEATATGCQWSDARVVRRFDSLPRAVAWGRGMAALAPFKSCDVVIDAIYDETAEEVYRVSRDRHGAWSVGPVTAAR
ncbi:MAG TPA: hypothetical protein VNA89_11775 [Gemmatimonadaceae bacterium]|nr:hypothetical protein [Gemmatimonadaceae bacterium]